MRNIFKTMLILASAAFTMSCMEEIDNSVPDNPQEGNLVEMTFTASFGEDTRTILDGTDVLWLPDDEIAINGQKFTTDIETPGSIASFRGEVEITGLYYALYPYSMYKTYEDGIYTIELPEVQKANKEGFDNGLNLSVAYQNDNSNTLLFQNVLGYVKFAVNESSEKIKSLTVRSNTGWSTVWGATGTVYTWNPSFVIDPGFKSVKLEADDFFENEAYYYIALYPNTYYGGLSFDFENKDGYIATLSINQEIELKAGEIKNIGLMKNLNFKPSPEMQKAAERDALIALFNSTGGQSWTNKDNWCSEAPLSDWYGVFLNADGYVERITLNSNNLSGEIPEEISNFSHIFSLDLSWNQLSGNIPESLINLKELEFLMLKKNQLTGGIPERIGDLPLLSLDLSYNNLTGNIPESIAKIMNENLIGLNLNHNKLSGIVPTAVIENEYFNEFWVNMLYHDGYTLDVSAAKIKAPIFVTTDIDGSTINSAEIYKNNEYTVLFEWGIGCGFSMMFIPDLKSWYDEYKGCGLEVLAYSCDDRAEVESIVEEYGLTWKNFKVDQFGDLFLNYSYFSDPPLTPFVAVVDRDGYIIHNPYNDNRNDIIKLFEAKWGDLGGSEDEKYESQDKSQDGMVGTPLQTASEGNGINIVLMGDGYSDRQIASGAYLTDITNAYNAFFSVEPYKTYKNLFNVYYVIAVSDNEGFAEGNSTVFEGHLSDAGSAVGGNNATVLEYARKAVSAEKMDETLAIVVMNDLRYGGTCVMYMYNDPESTGDWGSGAAIAYLPLSSSSANDTFAQVIHHEAGGHGFAKLADEYWDGTAAITEQEKQSYEDMEPYGFFKNIDFTDNPSLVKWSQFLSDGEYDYDGLGLFEGGLAYYAYGVYRPTEESIMRFNTGGFNAPSREAIYYRIHKLAYGPEWEYKYEDFVKYDAINRKSAAQAQTAQKRRSNYVEKPFEPTHPPVIVKGSWRDAME